MAKPPMTPPKQADHKTVQFIEKVIFASRWLQAPMYLGLIVAQGIYAFLFMRELWHMLGHITTTTETEVMLGVLGLIDVVMVANLLVMVIVGGYETFVSRLDLDDHPDQPEWLSHINAGVLKIKLAVALAGISGVHLLKSFLNAENLDAKTLIAQTGIHIVFIFSAFMLAVTEKVMHQAVKASESDH